jgi:predicted transcriptional regulator of viral defense system
MKLIDALSRLKSAGQPVLRTADAMALLNIRSNHASKLLSRLAEHGYVIRLKRGSWVLAEGLDPIVLAQHVTAPLPAYVSLQTALYHHGMISQIPAVIYCVSLARARVYHTSVATISVHHVQGSFFFGFEETGRQHVKIASREKALLDVLYLSPARSRLFSVLPELELPAGFSVRTVRSMIRRIPNTGRRSLVKTRFERLLLQGSQDD